ncbi:MAG: adenylyltransferase/cytidyltransferase family protein [archaeon]|nr:adenylyltransferase/cytidyltransferase family protein [archaeon]
MIRKNGKSEEILACFNPEDVKHFHTGKLTHVFPIGFSQAHREKIHHVIIRLFAKTLDGKYLVQKRSHNKRTHRGRWTDSCSGHVRYHENFSYEHIEDSVRRELEEEMGTNLLSLRFHEITLDEIDGDCFELCYTFLGIVEEKLKIDEYEVDNQSGYYIENELKKILAITEQKAWVEVSKNYWEQILERKMDDSFKGMIDEIQNKEKNQNSDNLKPSGIGLIIGRFQPFHLGHFKLVEKSFNYIEKLKIGIGSAQFSDTPENPFSYEERRLFIELSLSDIHNGIYTIYPIEDQFDIYKWIDGLSRTVGNFDVLITNNLWIGRLFQKKGKKIIFGLKFDFEKYNGTSIRNLIFSNKIQWMKLVPDSVYRFIADPKIMKRMKIIGKNQK